MYLFFEYRFLLSGFRVIAGQHGLCHGVLVKKVEYPGTAGSTNRNSYHVKDLRCIEVFHAFGCNLLSPVVVLISAGPGGVDIRLNFNGILAVFDLL